MSGQSSKRHPIVLQYTLRYFLNSKKKEKKKKKWLWGNLTFYHVLNKFRRKEKGNKNDSSIYAGGGRVVRRCWVNFQCQGVLLIWIIVGQGPTSLAVGAGGGCLDIFSLIYHFSFLSPSLWETARYRLKYCLKGPLSSDQPTNQHQFMQGKAFTQLKFPNDLLKSF